MLKTPVECPVLKGYRKVFVDVNYCKSGKTNKRRLFIYYMNIKPILTRNSNSLKGF
jgi:hypothetical protein